MIVVSNAGPLIALGRICRIDMIKSLFAEIIVPDAVYRETAGPGNDLPGVSEIRSSDWIKRFAIANPPTFHFLSERLDAGETEAIILSLEMEADLLLIDESRGRRVAESRGIDILGSVGCLVLAKRRGLVEKVTPILEELISSGFRMHGDLYTKARELAGE